MEKKNNEYINKTKQVNEWLEEGDNKEKVKSGLAMLGVHTIFLSLLNVVAYIIVAPFYFIFGGNEE